jgi:hypothetical protein
MSERHLRMDKELGPSRPQAGTPADIIRGLVLAAGGVTEPEAELLLKVLDQLRRIERQFGAAAAKAAARRVRTVWLGEVA